MDSMSPNGPQGNLEMESGEDGYPRMFIWAAILRSVSPPEKMPSLQRGVKGKNEHRS